MGRIALPASRQETSFAAGIGREIVERIYRLER